MPCAHVGNKRCIDLLLIEHNLVVIEISGNYGRLGGNLKQNLISN